jgi:ABC-type dipeptide/oligopeptide/nickel transport system permease component
MGTLLLEGINNRDYTLLQADVMVYATAVLTVNLLVDLIYGWLDPRIRYA